MYLLAVLCLVSAVVALPISDLIPHEGKEAAISNNPVDDKQKPENIEDISESKFSDSKPKESDKKLHSELLKPKFDNSKEVYEEKSKENEDKKALTKDKGPEDDKRIDDSKDFKKVDKKSDEEKKEEEIKKEHDDGKDKEKPEEPVVIKKPSKLSALLNWIFKLPLFNKLPFGPSQFGARSGFEDPEFDYGDPVDVYVIDKDFNKY